MEITIMIIAIVMNNSNNNENECRNNNDTKSIYIKVDDIDTLPDCEDYDGNQLLRLFFMLVTSLVLLILVVFIKL